MKTEEYNLVCKGELEPGFEQSAVVEQAAKLFKIDETKALKILDKKPQTLAKKLTWSKAVKYQQALKNIGLRTFLDTVLDPEIFRESLLSTSHQGATDHPATNKQEKDVTCAEIELQLLKLETSQLVPNIFARAHTGTLVDKNKEPMFLLESYNNIINQKFLLLLSIPVAFVVQNYFGMLLIGTFSGSTVTPLLILLFFLIILFLPKTMMPRRIFTLRQTKDDSFYLLCAEKSSLNPIIDTYDIYSSDNDFLAAVTYSRLRNTIECRDKNNAVLFSSSEEKNADKITKDMAAEMGGELFDFSYFSYIKMVFKQLKKIRAWSRREQPDNQRGDMFVVRDHSVNKVAYFHRDSIGTIEYPPHPSEENKNKTMIAFLLICLGAA